MKYQYMGYSLAPKKEEPKKDELKALVDLDISDLLLFKKMLIRKEEILEKRVVELIERRRRLGEGPSVGFGKIGELPSATEINEVVRRKPLDRAFDKMDAQMLQEYKQELYKIIKVLAKLENIK
jgi:hypothetical protein